MNRKLLLLVFLALSCNKDKKEEVPNYSGKYVGQEILKYRNQPPGTTKNDTTYAAEYEIVHVIDAMLYLKHYYNFIRFKKLPDSRLYAADYNTIANNALINFSNDTLIYETHVGGGIGGFSPYTVTIFTGRKQ